MQYHGLTTALFMMVALAGLGIYMMLPRGPESDAKSVRITGGVLGALAVAWLAYQFGQQLPQAYSAICFYVLAAVTVGSAALMISARNPVYSALWFAMVLLSNSGLYLMAGAEFLSAATVIIYAGAIIVTFLFVIMLAQPRGTASYDRFSREPAFSCAAGVILAATLIGTLSYSARAETVPGEDKALHPIRPNPALVQRVLRRPIEKADEQPAKADEVTPGDEQVAKAEKKQPELPTYLMPLVPAKPAFEGEAVNPQGKAVNPQVEQLGRTMFNDHYVSIEIIGVLLLIAVVGAVAIAARGRTALPSATPGLAPPQK
ncbi:MAG TPA: NADH-quinone oxidoreductase subunit J [Planctomycetaceae bacterium]|nr:NADH-quinone oxidoreductase subunit J [Planctomycetaceae bacterium]